MMAIKNLTLCIFTTNRESARAQVRWIKRKPAKDGGRMDRPLFGDGEGLTGEEQAYRFINQAQPGTVFFRFVIDLPKPENGEPEVPARQRTRLTMEALQRRIKTAIVWLAAEHDEYLGQQAHVVAAVSGSLRSQDYQSLGLTAKEAASLEWRAENAARPERKQRAGGWQDKRKLFS